MASAIGEPGSKQIVRLTVPEQLRRLLEEQRRVAESFEGAWSYALSQIVYPESSRETEEWGKVLAATKDTWRARYEGWQPEPRERAVLGLLEALAEAEAAAAEAAAA